jgi:hypothetical protein
MDPLPPELRLAVARAGDSPVRLSDPETRRTYVLVVSAPWNHTRRAGP